MAPLRRVGPYDLLTELGRGGMASVYLARGFGSAGFERLAAVKLLHRGLCADPDFVEMFLDEARVAARLHHPNATAIIDVGSEGPQLYMVMEYVEGDTLHAVQCAAVKLRRAVPLGIALRVALDALAGLDAAHELRAADGAPLGLIHRDVTPQNVLIGVDGAARLVDFGIARAACRTGVTTVGVLKGKLPFMAPEQIRGRGVDRRADIFSMGVSLWETIALRRCFPSREGAPLSRLANEPYRSLRELAPHAPEGLDAICRRALEFDPADRYSTAAEFAEAIENTFRADLATQRELGQFMTVVSATKVGAEREAARRSSHPMPVRSVRASARPSGAPRPAPVFDLRPPRVPNFGSAHPRPLQSPLGDGLIDAEDVTCIAHPTRPPPAPTAARAPAPRPAPARPLAAGPALTPDRPRRPVTLPPLPARSEGSQQRPSIAPRRDVVGSRFDVPAQAFSLQRPKPSLVPSSLMTAAISAPPTPSFVPDSTAADERVSEVRLALSPRRTRALELAPVSRLLELPAPLVRSDLVTAPSAPGRLRRWLLALFGRLPAARTR